MSILERWTSLRGRHYMVGEDPSPLEADWSFRRSRIGLGTRAVRAAARFRRKSFPRWQVIRKAPRADRWAVYFVYAPDGVVTPAHEFTARRLRESGRSLLVIISAPSPDHGLMSRFDQLADLLIWKALEGFDFSAFAIALTVLAEESPGADVFIMNDSVFGPFGDWEALLARAPWQLSGFTASERIENHIQSYAFQVRNISAATLAAVGSVISLDYAYDDYVDVIYAQETMFARVAARRLTTGALWHSSHPQGDPTLYQADDLLRHGYPFIKRKLLSDHSHLYPSGHFEAILAGHGHPELQGSG